MTVDTMGWDLDQRRRFGELTARSWFDADLRLRYEREPATVLTEYDIRLADGAPVPALPPEPGAELVIEALQGGEYLPPPCLFTLCFCVETT
ncbi:hypothetical protein [Sphaerisporangium fuscum]|uniref:hypothetical protein n=1 Tax=Sphaerisporangium fuscum TaxID=2835868 RepID=UPI001BDBD96C|nr:hypothetical protein [Sphaerisporangium fuscum]